MTELEVMKGIYWEVVDVRSELMDVQTALVFVGTACVIGLAFLGAGQIWTFVRGMIREDAE